MLFISGMKSRLNLMTIKLQLILYCVVFNEQSFNSCLCYIIDHKYGCYNIFHTSFEISVIKILDTWKVELLSNFNILNTFQLNWIGIYKLQVFALTHTSPSGTTRVPQ